MKESRRRQVRTVAVRVWQQHDHSRLEEIERKAIAESLQATGGHRLRAAKLLGVTRPTLYDLLAKNQIDATQFGRAANPAEDPADPQ